MGLKILSWSNSLTQYSGYATCQKHLLPRINNQSDHEVIQLACSGMKNAPPIVVKGVKIYPRSSYGGNLGEQDIEYIVRAEGVDLILPQLDVWTLPGAMKQLGETPQIPPIVVYAPVDHHGPEYMPAPKAWRQVFEAVDGLVPYCEFGKRVMEDEDVTDDKLWDPIYHGVNHETYSPHTGEIPFDVDEDDFVVGCFKALHGTRGAHDRVLRSFREFLDAEDAWDDAHLYLHCSQQGAETFSLPTLLMEFGLTENVAMPNPPDYRWFTDDDRMARLYSHCDVLLNTVRGEGFGLPILEAMSCETSVIAGAYSSMPELVLGEEGEITHEDVDEPVIDAPRGWLVPTWEEKLTQGKHNYRRRYNHNHIAAAIAEAYNNPEIRKEKGEKGREFAKQHPWDEKADQFIAIFDQLEDELWETEEDTGIEWETIGGEGAEHGGVGGFGGMGDTT